jgi:hypothetical protein
MLVKFYSNPFLNNYCHVILLLIGAAFSSTSYSFYGVNAFAPTVIHTASTAATETDALLQSIQQLDISARSSLGSGKVYKVNRNLEDNYFALTSLLVCMCV